MKIYGVRGGIMCEAEVQDGAIWLELGSRENAKGKRLPPITAIDEDARTFCRGGIADEPWPERYYREADIAWRPRV